MSTDPWCVRLRVVVAGSACDGARWWAKRLGVRIFLEGLTAYKS